jgi:hypothetical protein
MWLSYLLQGIVLLTGASAVIAVWDDLKGTKRKAFVCLFALGLCSSFAVLAWQYHDQRDANEKAAMAEHIERQIITQQLKESLSESQHQAELLSDFERVLLPIEGVRVSAVYEIDPTDKSIAVLLRDCPILCEKKSVIAYYDSLYIASHFVPKKDDELPKDIPHPAPLSYYLPLLECHVEFLELQTPTSATSSSAQTPSLAFDLKPSEDSEKSNENGCLIIQEGGRRVFYVTPPYDPENLTRAQTISGVSDLRGERWTAEASALVPSTRIIGLEFSLQGVKFQLANEDAFTQIERGYFTHTVTGGVVPRDWKGTNQPSAADDYKWALRFNSSAKIQPELDRDFFGYRSVNVSDDSIAPSTHP